MDAEIYQGWLGWANGWVGSHRELELGKGWERESKLAILTVCLDFSRKRERKKLMVVVIIGSAR